MQLSEMRTEARLIFNQPDPDNSHFSQAQLSAWANECYRYLLTKLESIPKTQEDYVAAARSADGQPASIALNANTLTMDEAYLQDPSDDKFKPLEIVDLATMNAIDPQWLSSATGAPKYLVRLSTFTAALVPPPDADHVGQTVRTFGLIFPDALSADADKPTVPANLHDVFPHYIAYRAFQQLNLPDRATQELILCNSLIKSQHAISTRFSRQLNQFTFEDAE